MKTLLVGAMVLALSLAMRGAGVVRGEDANLLNASYDPTRELYEEINGLFAESYQKATGTSVKIEQSHGGSSKQARGVIDGLKADVVTLALGYDVTAIEKAGLISPGWEKRLPNNAAPYTSTIVFLVRKGNPKGIKDWGDLIKGDGGGVQVVVANPKTSGGARWVFLAAWGYAAGANTHDLSRAEGIKEAEDGAKGAKDWPILESAKGKEFVTEFYKHVPVLDTGARGSTVTFAQKNIGDVLVNWENEAWMAKEEFGKDKFEIVYPSVSVLAEPPVAVVDAVVDAKGTRKAAEAYLQFLYTKEAQEVAGELHYRPRDAGALKKYEKDLPAIKLFTIDETFGGWERVQKAYFSDGGVFDGIFRK